MSIIIIVTEIISTFVIRQRYEQPHLRFAFQQLNMLARQRKIATGCSKQIHVCVKAFLCWSPTTFSSWTCHLAVAQVIARGFIDNVTGGDPSCTEISPGTAGSYTSGSISTDGICNTV